MPSTILSDNGVSSGSAGLKTTAASDGALALQTTTAGGTATTAVTIDTSQNLGLGVTPSAWLSTRKVVQNGNAALVSATSVPAFLQLSANTFTDSGGTDKYISTAAATNYAQVNGQHQWFYAASGSAGATATFTQAMTLDASGNLGVGTTSPSQKLDVVGSSSATAIRVATTGGAAGFFEASSNSGAVVSRLQSNVDGAFVGTLTNNYFFFQTNGTERARIDTGGNLLVGTTSASGKITIKPASNSYVQGLGLIASNSSNYWNLLTATDNNLYTGYNGADRGYFNSSTGAYTAVSDQRLKKNITDIQYGLNEVLALRSVSYNMNDQEDGDTKALGFIAQEALEVIPESVTEMMGGMYGMDKVALVPVLVKAIQELKAIVDAQAAEIAALKGNA